MKRRREEEKEEESGAVSRSEKDDDDDIVVARELVVDRVPMYRASFHDGLDRDQRRIVRETFAT